MGDTVFRGLIEVGRNVDSHVTMTKQLLHRDMCYQCVVRTELLLSSYFPILSLQRLSAT